MYILISSFLLLFTTIVQCQNVMINPINTGKSQNICLVLFYTVFLDIGTCPCDLNNGSCDVSCCCDKDCSIEDIKAFNCGSKTNEDMK